MFQTNLYVKSKLTCQVADIFFEYRAVYEIMWKNIVEPGRPQVTIWRMRIAWWIPEAANTYPEYVITTVFLSTMVARTRLNVTSYVIRTRTRTLYVCYQVSHSHTKDKAHKTVFPKYKGSIRTNHIIQKHRQASSVVLGRDFNWCIKRGQKHEILPV